MAYDAAKAHEYYENYTKKGKKKGRKKGKKKTTKSQKLVGLSVAGLNDAGKMEFALMKEEINAEMNAALKGATDAEERKAIRKEYQYKALQRLNEIKSNPSFAKQKSSSSKSSSKKSSSKSGGSKSSSSKSNSSSKSSTSSSNTSEAKTTAQKLEEATKAITTLTEKLSTMTEEQKTLAKGILTQMIDALKNVKGVDATALKKALEGLNNGNINGVG